MYISYWELDEPDMYSLEQRLEISNTLNMKE